MKIIALIILIIGVMSVLSQNPNTAISGTSDSFLKLTKDMFDNKIEVTLTNPEIYDKIGEDFTIELWFRKTVGMGEYRPLISKHNSQIGTDVDNGLTEFLLEVQYNDGINFFAGCGSFVNYGYYLSVDQPSFYPNLNKYIVKRNRWTHAAVSVDWRQDITGIPTGVAKLYVDGILVDAVLWAASSPLCNGRKRIRATGQPVKIGYFDNQDPGQQYWVGDIDELRIWSVARTEEEIKKYFVGGIPLDSEGIVSYHTFSEGQGTFSNNIILNTDGYPRVNVPDVNLWTPSDLKLTPLTAVTCPGYTVTMQPVAVGTSNKVDFYITKIVKNTDGKFLWTDYRRNLTLRSIRREITQADLPLNIGPWALANIIEYVPGKTIGVDTIYYEARNNGSWPEPSGPASLVFETRCCGNDTADQCRVCNGKGPVNGICQNTCDDKGGINDACGVCNGDGLSCRGCDGRPFSNKVYDNCGECGGNNECFPVCANGVIDECGICNGTNQCCVQYRGVPKDRIDHVLLSYTLDEMIRKFEGARSIINSSLDFVEKHNRQFNKDLFWSQYCVDIPSDLPFSLSNRIISMNSFCGVADRFIDTLDTFLTNYGSEIRVQWPPLNFPFNTEDVSN